LIINPLFSLMTQRRLNSQERSLIARSPVSILTTRVVQCRYSILWIPSVQRQYRQYYSSTKYNIVCSLLSCHMIIRDNGRNLHSRLTTLDHRRPTFHTRPLLQQTRKFVAMDDASFRAAVASIPKGTPNRWKTIAEQVGLPVDEVRKRGQPHLYNDDKLRVAENDIPKGTPHRWKLIAEQVGLPEEVVRKRLQSPRGRRRRGDVSRQGEEDESALGCELDRDRQREAHYTTNEDDEGLPVISKVQITLGKVLVLSDEYDFEIEDYHYAKSIVRSFESAGYSVEVWKLGFYEVIQALQTADFNILIILGAEIYDEYEFFPIIRQWVHAGGMLLLNGDGPNINMVFEEELNLEWSTADYGRLTHKRRQVEVLPNEELFLQSVPRTYTVEACLLDTPKEHQIFAADVEGITLSNNGLCAIASTPMGDGAIIFFGDVNAEVKTINILLSLCLGYERYPLCANCHRSDSSSKTKLLRCSRCNTAHYCDRVCQKKHWKKHKVVCSAEGVAQSVKPNDSSNTLDVNIPPSVANEESDEMMLAQAMSRDLLAMGIGSRHASASGADSWDSEDEERDVYGFTGGETMELISQGVKPWDEDARLVLDSLGY
jgi:hypothetical protein